MCNQFLHYLNHITSSLESYSYIDFASLVQKRFIRWLRDSQHNAFNWMLAPIDFYRMQQQQQQQACNLFKVNYELKEFQNLMILIGYYWRRHFWQVVFVFVLVPFEQFACWAANSSYIIFFITNPHLACGRSPVKSASMLFFVCQYNFEEASETKLVHSGICY